MSICDDAIIASLIGILCRLFVCSWAELWVMGLFLCLALMWITKQPQFVTGWGDLMPHKYAFSSDLSLVVHL